MSRRLLLIFTIVITLAVLTWAALKPHAQPAAARQGDKAQTVTIVQSKAEDVPQRVEAQATVVALKQVDVRAQVASTIRALHVREGQMVKAGQRLVTLDGRADAARAEQAASLVAQIDAQLKDAERNLERSKTLRQQGFVSASAVDAAQATVDVLRATRAAGEANTEASRVALSYQTLNASLTGRIGAVDVHEGSLVTPSATQPILTITQLDPIGLRFSLPQSELPRLMQAQTAGKIPVYATLDHGKTLAGVLTFVDSQVDSANGSIALKAEFGNPDHVLWPGMFTRVTVELGVSRQAIIVPSGAVQTGPNGQFVYVVQQDQTVKPQPVRLIRIFTREGKQFAVLDGVADGIKLVAEGGQNLRPGSKIVEAGKGKETAAKPSKDGRGNDKASANLTH